MDVVFNVFCLLFFKKDYSICFTSFRDSFFNICIDGVVLATLSGTIRNITLNRVTLGALGRTGVEAYYTGNMAEACIWNAALTTAEIASLAKGMTPDQIRLQNLVFHAPLVRDLQDVKNGLAMTNNNAVPVSDHPRIYT